jgi:hypothetical protein
VPDKIRLRQAPGERIQLLAAVRFDLSISSVRNLSTDSYRDHRFTFSIDHHKLIIIGADFVPVEPTRRTHIQIGIGQRYTVVVEAEPEPYVRTNESDWHDGNFWIRTTVADCFTKSTVGVGDYDRTGILRYDPDNVRNPITEPWPDVNSSCKDEAGLVPRLKWNVKPPSNSNGAIFGEVFSAKVDGKTGPAKKFPLGK